MNSPKYAVAQPINLPTGAVIRMDDYPSDENIGVISVVPPKSTDRVELGYIVRDVNDAPCFLSTDWLRAESTVSPGTLRVIADLVESYPFPEEETEEEEEAEEETTEDGETAEDLAREITAMLEALGAAIVVVEL